LDPQPRHHETLAESSLKHFQTLEGDAFFVGSHPKNVTACAIGHHPDVTIVDATSRSRLLPKVVNPGSRSWVGEVNHATLNHVGRQ
jgi:hypothetical protein